MARLLLALLALLVASPAAAQPKAMKAATPDRAAVAEAAVVAYAQAARPPVAPSKAHDAQVTVKPAAAGTVDRVTSRRALAEAGQVAAVSFQGSPRDVSGAIEPPAQPLFFGVSLQARR
jgi:hypothetical protein